MGLKLRGMELGAVVEFLHEYKTKRSQEEHQWFKISRFLTTLQMNHLYQYAKQESLYTGNLHDFMHVSVLHHIIRAKSVDDYKSSLKYAKFAWIEGTDIESAEVLYKVSESYGDIKCAHRGREYAANACKEPSFFGFRM